MGNTRKTYRTVIGALGGVALVAAVTSCTAAGSGTGGGASAMPGATVTPSPSRTPTPSPSRTPTPSPTSSTDPAATAAWAAEAVPTSGSAGFLIAQSGQLPDGTPGSFTLTVSTLPAGDYSLYLACRGDAEGTVTVTVQNADGATLTGPCTGERQGLDFSLGSAGATVNLLGNGLQPVEWALALTDRLPR